jgi:hypothetical protein
MSHLGNTLNLWRMQGIQLVLVLPLLRENSVHAVKKIIGFGTMLFRNDLNAPLNIPIHLNRPVI